MKRRWRVVLLRSKNETVRSRRPCGCVLAWEVGGLRLTDFRGLDATHYPLSLSAHPDERLQLLLSYRPDLFDRSSVEAIAGRLVRLLEGAVADPKRAIGRLDILGADEREERRGSDGSPAGIEGALEYASDLFERSSVEAIAGRLVRLLEGAVADPERAIGGSTFWALTSVTPFCGSGTRPRGRFRVRRYPSCSRRRLRARLRRTRWCSRTSG